MCSVLENSLRFFFLLHDKYNALKQPNEDKAYLSYTP